MSCFELQTTIRTCLKRSFKAVIQKGAKVEAYTSLITQSFTLTSLGLSGMNDALHKTMVKVDALGTVDAMGKRCPKRKVQHQLPR